MACIQILVIEMCGHKKRSCTYLPAFLPTVLAFQLPTGNMTSFSLGICDSTKICVTFVRGSETLLSVQLPKHLTVSMYVSKICKIVLCFGTANSPLTCSAYFSFVCPKHFPPIWKSAGYSSDSNTEHRQFGHCIRPQSETHALFWTKRKQTKKHNQNNHQNKFNSALH